MGTVGELGDSGRTRGQRANSGTAEAWRHTRFDARDYWLCEGPQSSIPTSMDTDLATTQLEKLYLLKFQEYYTWMRKNYILLKMMAPLAP